MEEVTTEILKLVKELGNKQREKANKKSNFWLNVLWIAYGAWLLFVAVHKFYLGNFDSGFYVLIALMWFSFWCLESKLSWKVISNNADSLAGWSDTLTSYGESVLKNMKIRLERDAQKAIVEAKNSEIAELLKEIDALKKSKKK